MISIGVFQIDNFTIGSPPNSFDEERPVIDVLFLTSCNLSTLEKLITRPSRKST